jgi:tetratricopeptide (TPR) repeat protein
MKLAILVLLAFVSAALAYNPKPYQPTEGERQLEAALEAAANDAVKVQIAKEMLDVFPDDIPMGRMAQNEIKSGTEDYIDYFKARMDKNRTAATSYLYARATGEGKDMAEQGSWIMHNDPDNYWGYFMAALAIGESENPATEEMLKLFETAIEKDPSRVEAYYQAAFAYEELKQWDKAIEAYQAVTITNPEEAKGVKFSIMGIYAQTRDAANYFKMADGLFPAEPVAATVQLVKGGDLTPDMLKGHATVLDFFEYWCGPCVNHSLPELNGLKSEGKLPFKVYSVHYEGMHEKAVKLIEGKYKNGNDWTLDFVWGSEELAKQMGGVEGYPSYYVLDSKGIPRAVLYGHSDTTVETLQWLIEEIEKRS